MESVELLCQIVIDILKEFSMEKRPLTVAVLKEAFSANKEISSLLSRGLSDPLSERRKELPNPQRQLTRAELKGVEASTPSEIGSMTKLQSAFLKILHSFGPIIKGDYEKQFCQLQKTISDCDSLESLGIVSNEMLSMVISLINDTVDGISFSNEFLVELSKDLYKMEEQLYSYQNHNRETYLLSSEFHNNLLLHTGDMSHALDIGNNFEDVRHQITSKLSAIARAIAVKRQGDEARLQEADKKIAELQISVRNHNEEIAQVTERAKTLEKEVMLDALTEIHNRRAYELQMRESLRRYHRDGQPFSLVLMDVDRFKNINDRYGHIAGDKCLKEIAKIIKSSFRKTDFLARYGGEELVAILPGSSADNAGKIAEKVRSRIELARFRYQQEEIPITISLGVTEVKPTDQESEAVFSRVDSAMYQAKKGGRNKVCVI